MKRFSVAVAVLALACLPVISSRAAHIDRDQQMWFILFGDGKIGEQYTWRVEEELRITGETSELSYFHTDIGVTRTINEWFDVSLNFREISTDERNGWEAEHRPHINGIFKWALGDWMITDRNRFEYRIRKDKDDEWRYRNKISIYAPAFTEKKIRPFVAQEFFIPMEEMDLYEMRTFIGITSKLSELFTGQIAYMLGSEKPRHDWVYTDVFHVTLGMNF
jgi:hypothetical protein